MEKVKIFNADEKDLIESSINDFIKENPKIKIISIKYDVIYTNEHRFPFLYHSFIHYAE